ncbi:MAG: hypothetical protein ACR2MK_03580 [Solirubrobacteraceae bacterium]
MNIPVGDGWIVGGAYIRGGPYPGLDECESQTYTATATDTSTGATAVTQTVAGGHSYTLVVPAGSYALGARGMYNSGDGDRPRGGADSRRHLLRRPVAPAGCSSHGRSGCAGAGFN